MGVENDKLTGDGNTIKKVESSQGTYKPSVPEGDVASRLPQQQLPQGPDPKPFKIKGE